MSPRWEVGKKVQALKGWVRQRFGRADGSRRGRTAGHTDQVAGELKQTGGKSAS